MIKYFGAGFARIAVILALYATTTKTQYNQYHPIKRRRDQAPGNLGRDITKSIPYVYNMQFVSSSNIYNPLIINFALLLESEKFNLAIVKYLILL